jgi:hypothetical protein
VINIPAGKTLVTVLRRAGLHANAFRLFAGSREGQLLVIVNRDDNPIVGDGSYGISDSISAGGSGIFFFAASAWTKIIVS